MSKIANVVNNLHGETTEEILKTHVVIVLDSSGSMGYTKAETVAGFNEQVEAIQDSVGENHDTFVSLITFNHVVTPVFLNKPVNTLRKLTEADYIPRGMTAMLDGVGLAISEVEKVAREEESVLVIIISDGAENSSKNYSYEEIAEKIQAFTDTGKWTFTYMGAEQDLSQVSKKLNISLGNMSTYSNSSADDVMASFSTVASATANYMRSRSVDLGATLDFYSPPGDSASGSLDEEEDQNEEE